MRILIVEDDHTSRLTLQRILEPYGECHSVEGGQGAIDAIRSSLEKGEKYDLLCLDYLLPEKDGQEVLVGVRRLEKERGIPDENMTKVIVITGLEDVDNALGSMRDLCDAYLVKPLEKAKLLGQLQELGLIPSGT